jgi:hypothetical protein
MKLWMHFCHYISHNPDKVATILFYVGTISLAIFTYNQAKKQLFFPMRTETYRLTTKLLSEIQDYFVGFDAHELSKRTGLIDLAAINLSFMLDLYAEIVLKISSPESLKVWKTTTKKYLSLNPIALALIAFRTPGLRANFFDFKVDDYRKFIRTKSDWMEKYQHFIIFAPDSYETALSKIHSCLSSPFLPAELIPYLESLRDDLIKQREEIRNALHKMADDVGNEISTEQDFLSKADAFYPRIIRVVQDLSPHTKAISKAIRHYMHVDDLFKA